MALTYEVSELARLARPRPVSLSDPATAGRRPELLPGHPCVRFRGGPIGRFSEAGLHE